MPDRQTTYARNGLLSRLSASDLAAIRPHLEPVALSLRQTQITAHEPITHVYFPEAGYSSVTANRNGARIEVGIIGREGLVGAALALGVESVPFDTFVQHPGEGQRLRADMFTELLGSCPSLRGLALLFAQILHVQTASTAYANAESVVETRLARWLLMCHDRLDGDEIIITHEFLALMLGVRRAGVTTATHILEGNGVIRARRGLITVLDRERLEEMAHDAYGLAEAEYARVMVSAQG